MNALHPIRPTLPLILIALVLCGACDGDTECSTSSQCEGDAVCREGMCVSRLSDDAGPRDAGREDARDADADGGPGGCRAESCAGCCDGRACVDGTTAEACGASGSVCIACEAGHRCAGGECVPDGPACPDPAGCPTGCCEGTVCHPGDARSQCGAGGGACGACGAGQACEAGACVPDCSGRLLLGQGTLAHWRRKGAGFSSCKWARGAVDPTSDCRFFDRVWSSPWPGTTVRRDLQTFGDEGRQFIAMEFDSGDIPFDHEGRLTQEVPQFGGASSATKLWSISHCPGDFNQDLIEADMGGPGCIRQDEFGVTQSFNYGGPAPANVADRRRCALQPNTRYFLNIVFTQDEPGTSPAAIQPHPTCVSARCGVPITPAGTYRP